MTTPAIRILRGTPAPEELAALLLVLQALTATPAPQPPPPTPPWPTPTTPLTAPPTSWSARRPRAWRTG
ncbi:acyl-CoA carboxylase epsilon subunit [Streptomyces sp. NPDC085481]|uniref:acyl-CoA carboxylase epsilon subunit n=1 Tax=Streptomyces sp. NPDC085481 TaxID=3365727 RepID=UPI0037CD2B2C